MEFPYGGEGEKSNPCRAWVGRQWIARPGPPSQCQCQCQCQSPVSQAEPGQASQSVTGHLWKWRRLQGRSTLGTGALEGRWQQWKKP